MQCEQRAFVHWSMRPRQLQAQVQLRPAKVRFEHGMMPASDAWSVYNTAQSDAADHFTTEERFEHAMLL
jgi:hypothetical protein